MWRTYAPEPRMRLNLGIRRRLAPLLDNDRRKIELLNAILFYLKFLALGFYNALVKYVAEYAERPHPSYATYGPQTRRQFMNLMRASGGGP